MGRAPAGWRPRSVTEPKSGDRRSPEPQTGERHLDHRGGLVLSLGRARARCGGGEDPRLFLSLVAAPMVNKPIGALPAGAVRGFFFFFKERSVPLRTSEAGLPLRVRRGRALIRRWGKTQMVREESVWAERLVGSRESVVDLHFGF